MKNSKKRKKSIYSRIKKYKKLILSWMQNFKKQIIVNLFSLAHFQKTISIFNQKSTFWQKVFFDFSNFLLVKLLQYSKMKKKKKKQKSIKCWIE